MRNFLLLMLRIITAEYHEVSSVSFTKGAQLTHPVRNVFMHAVRLEVTAINLQNRFVGLV